MSMVSSVKVEDQDGFYSGQRKRPLSIIEENDDDEGDVSESTPVKGDVINPAPEIKTKEITIETKASSTASTKPVAKSNGIKRNEPKKKPLSIDVSRTKTQSLSSNSKPKSPKSKTPPVSPDSKNSIKVLQISKNMRVTTKTDPKSKLPPPVAPKPKTPSPSPSKVGDRHFAFHKTPTTCSQSKMTVPKSRTPDKQTSEVEVARSMKNIVKRTVSKIENHVASISSTSKQNPVKIDPPRRKISKEEAPNIRSSFKKKENCTVPSTSTSDTGKPEPSMTSTSSSNETQKVTLTVTPASPIETAKSTDSPHSSSDKSENPTDTQTSTPISEETGIITASTPTCTLPSIETEVQISTSVPQETKISDAALTSTSPTNDEDRGATPVTSKAHSNGTLSTTTTVISTSDCEADKHMASTASTLSSEIEKQNMASQTGDTEKSLRNVIEARDTLIHQGENTQLSTSGSSSPEFTTPPSSPLLPRSKQIPNVIFSPLLSSKTSHSPSEYTRTSGSGSNSKSGQILSDGQGLARIREAAESLKLTSSSPLVPKASPSPPSRRVVPFSFRQSPKLSHRPFSEAYSFSSSLNNAKPMGPFNSNVLSVPSQFSTKADSGTSDSENEDKCQTKTGEKSRIAPRSPFLMPKFHPRRGSYFFKRRISSESLASLSENESTDNAEEPTPISASDFNQLIETADRLHLSTRRPSVLQWRQQYVESPGTSGFPFKNGMNGDSLDEKLTSERKQKIDEALEWLRNELHEMRSQDQALARQLLTIRNDIHQLKLRRCTTEHQELLDDFKLEIEEQQEFSDVLDIPQPIYEDNPLKHIGVTRLNISARRFSAC